jgi:hypothetical protein
LIKIVQEKDKELKKAITYLQEKSEQINIEQSKAEQISFHQ